MFSPQLYMQRGFWVQQQEVYMESGLLDETLMLNTYSSVPTQWVLGSVPTPLMQSSVSTQRRMRPSNPSHRRRYRFEIPPRMRRQHIANIRMRSVPADATIHSNETVPGQQNRQNPQNHNERVVGSELSEEYISAFLISSLSRPTSIEGDIFCTICQDEINVDEEMITLSCKHVYHMRCIEKWLKIKNECAVCRASVIPIEDVGRILH